MVDVPNPAINSSDELLKEVEALLEDCEATRKKREHAILESRALASRHLQKGRVYKHRVPGNVYSFFVLNLEEKRSVWIKVNKHFGDCELYASCTDEHPTRSGHAWAFTSEGSFTACLRRKDLNFKGSTIYFSIFGKFTDGRRPISFSVSWGYRRSFLESKGFRDRTKVENSLTNQTRLRLESLRSRQDLCEKILKGAILEREEREKSLRRIGSKYSRSSFNDSVCSWRDLDSTTRKQAERLLTLLTFVSSATKLVNVLQGESSEAKQDFSYAPTIPNKLTPHMFRLRRMSSVDDSSLMGLRVTEGRSDRSFLRMSFRSSSRQSTFHEFLPDRHFHPLYNQERKNVVMSNQERKKAILTRPQSARPRKPSSPSPPPSNSGNEMQAKRPGTAISSRQFTSQSPTKRRPSTALPRHSVLESGNNNNEPRKTEGEIEVDSIKGSHLIHRTGPTISRVLDCSQKEAHMSLAPLQFSSVSNDAVVGIGGLFFANFLHHDKPFLFIPVFDGEQLIGVEIGCARHPEFGSIHFQVGFQNTTTAPKEVKQRTTEVVKEDSWVEFFVSFELRAPSKTIALYLEGHQCSMIPSFGASMASQMRKSSEMKDQVLHLSKVMVWKGAKQNPDGSTRGDNGTTSDMFSLYAKYDLGTSLKPRQFKDECGNHHDAFGNGGAQIILEMEHVEKKEVREAVAEQLFSLFDLQEMSQEQRERRTMLQSGSDETSPRDSEGVLISSRIENAFQLARDGRLDDAYHESCIIFRLIKEKLSVEHHSTPELHELLQHQLNLKQRVESAVAWLASTMAHLALSDKAAIIRLPEFVWVEREVQENQYSLFTFELDRAQSFRVVLDVVDGDPDLYMSFVKSGTVLSRNDFPLCNEYLWASAGDGADEIFVPANDENIGEGAVLISVFGATSSKFRVRILLGVEEEEGEVEREDPLDLDPNELQVNQTKYWFAKLGNCKV